MKSEELNARCEEMRARMKHGSAATSYQYDLVSHMEKAESQKRFVNQAGQLVRGRDGWMARYYVTDPLKKNHEGNWGKRVKHSERLCGLDVERYAAAKKLKTFMKAENSRQRGAWVDPTGAKQTVAAYWTDTYFPMIEENRAWATADSYKHLWATYCSEYMKDKVLANYETKDANLFLTELATRRLKCGPHKGEKGLSRNAINAVRSLCSGLFTHACNNGTIDRNPFRDVKVYEKIRKPDKTIKYELSEVVKMLNSEMRTDAKLVVSLACFAGLMPSEIAAVRWENIVGNVLTITQSAPAGHLGETKTENRQGTVLLIAPVMRLLAAYRKERGKATGFLFQKNGSLLNMNYFAASYIKPFARKAIGKRWNGLYAARRACGTLLYNLTGDSRASYQVLRNTAAISEAHYIGPDVEQGRSGQLVLEQAFEAEAARLKA